jgi:mannose-6-phosphate isomerase-like protein (cupin superfamily)
MRTILVVFLLSGSIGLASTSDGTALAQTATPARQAAPRDRAVDFKNGDLDQIAQDLAAKKLITDRILEGGTYSVNVRHISGTETALVHGKITEVWVVRDGSGTVATGGELADPKPGAGPGDFSGGSIRGGVERQIQAGDIVFIPPGVPHGIKQTESITYLNIRFETK